MSAELKTERQLRAHVETENTKLYADLERLQGQATSAARPYNLDLQRMRAELEEARRRLEACTEEYEGIVDALKERCQACEEEVMQQREMYLQRIDDLTRKLEKSECFVVLYRTRFNKLTNDTN